jgi:hypothetical protein
MTATIEARPDMSADELIGALAAMKPWDRHRVLKRAGMDPGSRTWTATGRRLGVPQELYGDYVVAAWPAEVVRHHRVYFIQAGESDADGSALVKIGFTTDVASRMRQLQTASPMRLKVLDQVIGTHAIEAYFHRLLRARHVQGEWFKLNSDSISYALGCLWEDGLSWQ